jgi:transposase InsO family protein
LLRDHQAVRSQSRRGDCYDNVQAESLWLRLKMQVLEGRERLLTRTLGVTEQVLDLTQSN